MIVRPTRRPSSKATAVPAASSTDPGCLHHNLNTKYHQKKVQAAKISIIILIDSLS